MKFQQLLATCILMRVILISSGCAGQMVVVLKSHQFLFPSVCNLR